MGLPKVLEDAAIIAIIKTKYLIKKPHNLIILSAFPLLFNFAILWLGGYRNVGNALRARLRAPRALRGVLLNLQLVGR